MFFSHAQHVMAAGLECKACHGDVDQMHRVKQVNDLSMGWCLDCHKTQEINVADNSYYAEFKQLHDDIKAGRLGKITPADMGANDCMKCHY
ncbi:MAG: cytochrome c3 family protein [Breznakibacter sp.]